MTDGLGLVFERREVVVLFKALVLLHIVQGFVPVVLAEVGVA